MGASPRTRVGRAPENKVRRPTRTVHPWDQIRDHYVTAESGITIKELAEVYQIGEQVIRNRCSQDRWNYRRAEYIAMNQKRLRDARSRTLTKEAIGFDDQSLKAAKLGQTLILGRLGQIAAIFQAQSINFEAVLQKIRNGQPLQKHELKSGVDFRELVELANALDRFQNVGRKALGTDVEKIDISTAFSVGEENHVSIGEELGKVDLDRMSATISAMRRAGLSHLLDDKLALPSAEGAEDDGEELGSEEEGMDSEHEVLEGEIVR